MTADTSRARAAERLASPPRHPKPSFAMLDGEARVCRFVDELRARAGEVFEIGCLADLRQALERCLGDLSGLAVSGDGAFAGLFETVGPDARDARLSLTHAWGGVAETGTLVLTSGPLNPTTLVFLPEVHAVAVARDKIFAAYEDALSALVRETGSLPRTVNLVSGPSRTGDIGGRIVLGAHGPKRLLVFLYA